MTVRETAIRMRGVRVHNLKNANVDIPLGALTAVSGVSGSGKSSLAMDTLHAEGQRRYIETFSPYTRQFLERLEKPDADLIAGIPPSIAVGGRLGRKSARSTVGTMTEIHHLTALLFTHVGKIICRSCGRSVNPATPENVAKAVESFPEGSPYLVTFPVDLSPASDWAAIVESLKSDGFSRLRIDGSIVKTSESAIDRPTDAYFDVVVDRLRKGAEGESRRVDSIETALAKGFGRVRIVSEADGAILEFQAGGRCPRCGTDAPTPDPRIFRYNNPESACEACEGLGVVVELDLERIVPDPAKTLRQGAIAVWEAKGYAGYKADLLDWAASKRIAPDSEFRKIASEHIRLLIEGDKESGFIGLQGFFSRFAGKAHKPRVRSFLDRWRAERPCRACTGYRLRPPSLSLRVSGRHFGEVLAMTIEEAIDYFSKIQEAGGPIERTILKPVKERLEYLARVGLGYLTLDRSARTLSAGESRRVSLTGALGSGLVNTLYVLDEPSVGLHPADIDLLTRSVKRLRDLGNTVVVVEHEEALIRAADRIVEIGPGAGEAGGRVIHQGPPEEIERLVGSPTGDYLSGRKRVTIPIRRREPKEFVKLTGARGNNLKEVDVAFPLGVLCVVTGVSGSGKSSLVEETLYPALFRRLGKVARSGLPFRELTGTSELSDVVLVDDAPIGRSSRSNPVTFIDGFNEIRKTFAATHEAKIRNIGASKFSFNLKGGRCDACEGTGTKTIDMQFLADVTFRCPECAGRRFRPEILEIKYRNRSIDEVLNMTVREAFGFFKNRPKIQARLRPLMDVGLDYVRLGQPVSTLSGGEARRLKLATHVASSPTSIARASRAPKSLFLFDEPTSGLHPADILRLLDSLTSLLALGHSLIVIEHNVDVMLSADWIIDLGPGAGNAGGRITAAGTPEGLATTDTPTGRVLADAFRNRDREV